jgi:hypothetical protein
MKYFTALSIGRSCFLTEHLIPAGKNVTSLTVRAGEQGPVDLINLGASS